MKIIPNERLKFEGEYHPADKPCDVPDDVGKQLIDDGRAKLAQGRPSGGRAEGGGSKPPTANQLIAEIAETDDVERLQELAKDSRKTVSEAASARLDELDGGRAEGGDGDGDADGEGADGGDQ